jgi:Ca-activated chloride channel family protein
VPLTIVSSPDQSKTLSAVAKDWSDGKPSVGGKCATVEVVTKASADVAAALSPGWDPQRDGNRPDVWAPESSIWLETAAARSDAAAMIPSHPQSIATSPTVIAMPRPMAEALGWPGTMPGWRDLVRKFGSGGGWGTLRHPEWGAFKVAMPDPTRSTAGLQSLVAITDVDNDKAVSAEELRDAVSLEHAVTSTPADTDEILQKLQEADAQGKALTTFSAFPATERDVSEYNRNGPQVPLVALYPPEGTPDNDHPYVVLTAPWVDSTRQQIADDFLAYLAGSHGRSAYGAEDFRPPTRVSLASLTDDRGLIPELATPPRVVSDPDTVTRTVVTWTSLRRRSTVLVTVDVSGSMNEPAGTTGRTKLQLAQQAMNKAVSLFNDQSQLGLWAFSTKQTTTTDYREVVPVGPIASRRATFTSAINGLKAQGATGLYDTVVAAYARAQKTWRPGQLNAIVLLSDGANLNPAGLTRAQMVSKLMSLVDKSKPIQLLTVAYGADANVGELRSISDITGGRTFESRDPGDIEKVLISALFGG